MSPADIKFICIGREHLMLREFIKLIQARFEDIGLISGDADIGRIILGTYRICCE